MVDFRLARPHRPLFISSERPPPISEFYLLRVIRRPLHALQANSAEKLRTTSENKRKHYLMRQAAKRHYVLVDALYANFRLVLQDRPRLAERLYCELDRPTKQDEWLAQISELSPARRLAS